MKVTRPQIVAAARELFRDVGFGGASMGDLAERLGVGKASLYSRFPSKAALVEPVLAQTLDEAFDADLNDPWLTVYERLIRRIADGLVQRRRCVALHLVYDRSEPSATAAAQAFFVETHLRLVAVLVPALGPVRADQEVRDALAQVEGATLWLTVDGDEEAMERAVQRIITSARASPTLPTPPAGQRGDRG